MNMMYFIQRLFLIFLFSVTSVCFAGLQEQFQSISQLAYRPTISQTMSYFSSLEYSYDEFRQQVRTDTVDVNLRRDSAFDASLSIARVEGAYPNALFFFIGRDSFLASDLYEAFYSTIGQGNRVKRLHVSTPTFNGLTQEEGHKLLMTNGLDVTGNRPIVFLDETSFQSSSQSRKLYNWARELMLDAGLSEEFIAKNLGVAALGEGRGGTSRWSYQNVSELDALKTKNAGQYAMRADAKGITYGKTGMWTGKYESLQLHDGELRGTSSSSGQSQRAKTIFEQFLMIEVGTSTRFRDLVVEHARSLGYEFPLALSEADLAALSERERIAREEALEAEKVRAEAEAALVAEAEKKQREDAILAFEQQLPQAFHSILESAFTAYGVSSSFFVNAKLEVAVDANTVASVMQIAQQAVENGEPLTPQLVENVVSSQMGLGQQVGTPKGKDLVPYFMWLLESLPSNPVVSEYMSPSGLLIREIYKNWFSSLAPVDYLELISKTSPAITKAFENGQLDRKDYRRIWLFLLSQLSVPEVESRHYGILDSIVTQDLTLRGMLIERREVFLTSSRYDGKAKEVYLNIVSYGSLPELTCKELLMSNDGSQ